MIQEVGNAFITLLLAKFALNDVPHAIFSNPPRYYYHVTTKRLLESVLVSGLIPQERTGDVPDQWGRVTRRIYLLEEYDEARFYGDVLLRVAIPPGVRVKQSMYTEGVYVTRPIPSRYIEVYKELS